MANPSTQSLLKPSIIGQETIGGGYSPNLNSAQRYENLTKKRKELKELKKLGKNNQHHYNVYGINSVTPERSLKYEVADSSDSEMEAGPTMTKFNKHSSRKSLVSNFYCRGYKES